MKESYWGFWLIILGVFVAVVMVLTQDATTTNTQDYYQLKEAANSAIYDSIDYAYYSQTHQIRIMKEVFVENFIRRFAETVGSTDTFRVDFYDLYESPPKVSVKISSKTAKFMIAKTQTDLDVVNSIDIIVQFNNPNGPGDGPGSVEITGCDYYL